MSDHPVANSGEEMWAVVLDRFGPPEVLDYRLVPLPRVGDDEVLIEVRAVSVNRTLDLLVRQDGNGRRVELPHVLGVDPTGVIAATGANVRGLVLGQRVAVIGASAGARCGRCDTCHANAGECLARFHLGVERWGGYAQFVRAPAWMVFSLPEGLDFPEATIVVRHYAMARRMLALTAALRTDDRVLVMGAAGALGSAGVEIARDLGARVIAAAGADDRVTAAMKLGAEWGINYREQGLESEVARITDGRGVDVVFENIGDPELFPQAFASLAEGGRLLTAGAHGGGRVELDVRRLYGRRLTVYGTVGSRLEDLEWVLEAARTGRLHPLIGAVLPLSEARHAHELVAGSEVIGKVILDPTL